MSSTGCKRNAFAFTFCTRASGTVLCGKLCAGDDGDGGGGGGGGGGDDGGGGRATTVISRFHFRN